MLYRQTSPLLSSYTGRANRTSYRYHPYLASFSCFFFVFSDILFEIVLYLFPVFPLFALKTDIVDQDDLLAIQANNNIHVSIHGVLLSFQSEMSYFMHIFQISVSVFSNNVVIRLFHHTLLYLLPVFQMNLLLQTSPYSLLPCQVKD